MTSRTVLLLALLGLPSCWLLGGNPQAQVVRRTYQAFTTGIGLPNVTVDLTGGTGLSPFTSVDNVQVTVERRLNNNVTEFVWAAVDELTNDFRTLTVNVIDAQTGGPNPNPPPMGVKVWIIVEGRGP